MIQFLVDLIGHTGMDNSNVKFMIYHCDKDISYHQVECHRFKDSLVTI